MAGAFQSSAFQNSAFQVDAAVVVAYSNSGGGGGGRAYGSPGKKLDESLWDEVIRYARTTGVLEPDAAVPETVVAAIAQIRRDVEPARRGADLTTARAAVMEIRALLRRAKAQQERNEQRAREAEMDEEDSIMLLLS